ncbi:MAG: preprotein translocase subunit SecG [Treponema sp.]|jgi:preprotein translocase subunit SecG|nr:preprotein translocase subunit SecG [Treponema sp.]
MGVLSVVLLAFFVIAAILLILLVLVQNEEGDSLGGIFSGGSSSAFGSRSGNVLTRATSILGAVFLALSFGLALINRTPDGSGVESAGRQLETGVESDWWQETEAPGEDQNQDLLEIPETGGVESTD